jgi:hypothetical protein
VREKEQRYQISDGNEHEDLNEKTRRTELTSASLVPLNFSNAGSQK